MVTHPRLGEILNMLYPGLIPRVDWLVEDTGDGPVLTEWNAAQAAPTQADIDNANIPALEDARDDREATGFEQETGLSPKDKTILHILFLAMNEAREGNGKQPITRAQFRAQARAIYRGNI